MKKTESFWTIFATLTGGQKFTVIRNILVLPILLIALELGVGGGLYGIAALPWIALPFYLWSNVVRGKTLHRLHLPGGFLTRPSKLWVWYLIAGVIGAAYSAAWIGISAASSASELVMVHVNNVASGFLAAATVVMGIRKGWSDVIPADQPDASTQGQQVLHLVNPAGIAQRQLIFNIVGVLIFIGALAQVGQSMARIANTDTSASPASTDDDALVDAMANGTSLPTSDAQQGSPTQGISDPAPTPGLTRGTYGNQVVSHYPGQSPLNAATYALRYLKMPYQLGGIDAAGYVSIEATCEGGQGGQSCDIYLNSGAREHTANVAGFAGTLWPVNPSDVQIALAAMPGTDEWLKVINALAANKIACMGPICFDKAQHVVGRATQQTLASEVSVAQWQATGQSQQAASSASPARTQPAPVSSASTDASGLTANTYGNRVTSFYPGKAPLDAYVDALSQIHSYLSVGAIDYLGYPSYDVECEKNGQCYGGEGAAIGSIHDVAGEMFPVDPADINRYSLSCHVICYDTKGNIIGRDPGLKE